MAQKYAKGTRAWGICGRGGHRVLLKDMVFDGRYPNMRVDPAWYEDKHPQEFLPKVEDPIALYRPAVEVITGPTAPVLAVILTGTQASLTWSPSETDITEIDSYTIMRSVDGAPAVVLIVCAVLRDFLGGIIGVQHCTTAPSIPRNDTSSGSVYDKVTNEDAPITYVDTTLSSGHTYCYTVFSTPMGNNQSVAQGPPSANSNTVCVSTSAGTGLIWTFRTNFGSEVQALATHAGLTLAVDINLGVHESSDGGVTWAPLSTIPTTAGGNLIFNNGVWIFAAGPQVARSIDNGATWSLVNTGIVTAGFSTVGGNGANTLVIAGNINNPVSGTAFARSTDNGLTWTTSTPMGGLTLYPNPPLWDGAQFVAIASSATTTQVATSADGATWNLGPVGNILACGVQLSGGVYLAGSFTTGDASIVSATPAALATNTPVPIGLDNNGLSAVLAAAGLYFAFNSLGGVSNSSDGVTWLPGVLNMGVGENTDSQQTVVYDAVNACYIAGGSNGSICTINAGSGGWSKVDGGVAPTLVLKSVAILDATHIVAMDPFGSGVISSDAGATWTPVTVTSGDVASSLITNASGSVVLMIDNANLLLWRSTDHGATWASQGPISPIHPIVFYFAAADRFFYFDTLGNVQYSTDGLTWTQQALPAGFLPAEGFQAQNQCGQAQSGAHIALAGQDVTTGSFGQVLVSTDAIHWTVGTTDTANDNPYVCIVALGANYVASAIGNSPNPHVVDLFSVPIAQAAIPADWALISSSSSVNVPPFNQQLVTLGSLFLSGFNSAGTLSAHSSDGGATWSLANPMVDSQNFLYADVARAYAYGTNLYETTDGVNWAFKFFAGAGGVDGPLAVLSAHGLTIAVGSTGSIWKRT